MAEEVTSARKDSTKSAILVPERRIPTPNLVEIVPEKMSTRVLRVISSLEYLVAEAPKSIHKPANYAITPLLAIPASPALKPVPRALERQAPIRKLAGQVIVPCPDVRFAVRLRVESADQDIFSIPI